MELDLLFQLALLLLAGLLGARLIRLIRLPDVTGYLILGLLIGPSVLGLFTSEGIAALTAISDVALGFIAFTVGGEFKFEYFRRVGATPIVIAFFESIMAVVLVVLGLWATGNGLPFALVLGAIAAATAPAATVMVIKQYRAKGPVTETLLSVVALDDAVALIAFGLAVAVARTLESGGPVNLVEAILSPIWEVVLSVGVGLLLGILFTFLLRFFKDAGSRLSLSIAFVLGAVALANEVLGVSSLLMCMALGAAFCNLSKNSADVYRQVDAFTPPLFMMFFVLSGADLQLSVLPTIGVVGVVYVVLRVAGKWLGAWMGAKIMHASPAITKYLGPALIPQAGVAIGLSFLAQQVVPQYAATIRAVVLCATLIYELIGPAVSKKTLQAAGEIAKDA